MQAAEKHRKQGGAIYNSGTVAINNSTLSGNSANGFSGGGIYNDSVVKIDNSTLSGNTGSPSGGGIYNSGTATLRNSLVARALLALTATAPQPRTATT